MLGQRRTGTRSVGRTTPRGASMSKSFDHHLASLSLRAFAATLMAGALALAAPVQAEISGLDIIAPANPGGGWDQTARAMQAALQADKLASGVQVENIGGAGGTIGLAQFVSSKGKKGDAVLVGGLVMVGAILTNKSPVTLANVTPIARLTGEYERDRGAAELAASTHGGPHRQAQGRSGFRVLGRRLGGRHRPHLGGTHRQGRRRGSHQGQLHRPLRRRRGADQRSWAAMSPSGSAATRSSRRRSRPASCAAIGHLLGDACPASTFRR